MIIDAPWFSDVSILFIWSDIYVISGGKGHRPIDIVDVVVA